MNIILLFLGISSFVDAYYEDKNIQLIILKYIIAFVSLFQVFSETIKAVQRPEIFINYMIRNTIGYFFKEYFINLHYKNYDDLTLIDKIFCRFDSCDGGELKYRFIKEISLVDNFNATINKHNYFKNTKLKWVCGYPNLDLGGKVKIPILYKNKKMIIRVNTSKNISVFKINNELYIYVLKKFYFDRQGIFKIGLSNQLLGFDFMNQEVCEIVKKGGIFTVNLYRKLDDNNKYQKLKDYINIVENNNIIQLRNLDFEEEYINNCNLILEVDDENDIDLFEDTLNFGWVI